MVATKEKKIKSTTWNIIKPTSQTRIILAEVQLIKTNCCFKSSVMLMVYNWCMVFMTSAEIFAGLQSMWFSSDHLRSYSSSKTSVESVQLIQLLQFRITAKSHGGGPYQGQFWSRSCSRARRRQLNCRNDQEIRASHIPDMTRFFSRTTLFEKLSARFYGPQ